nr:helix-turn-helix domain-containing protein [Geotalea sp. SG265]
MSRVELGLYLREAREARGFQLDDVAATTRISKNYLVAIEAGDFEKLPNPAYVKGFLRLYAGFVGLSGDDVIAMYERTGDKAEDAEEGTVSASTTYSAKPAARRRFTMPLILLILVLIAAVFIRQNEEEKVVVSASTPRPQPVAPAVAPPPIQQAVSSARPEAANLAPTPAVPAGETASPPSVAPGKGLFLKLKCNQDSALNVTIDENLSQHYDLKAGDLIEWKAENSIALDLGNAGGVEAELNGKTLKPFGAAGASTHVVLKPGGTL